MSRESNGGPGLESAGRGAVRNVPGRFEKIRLSSFDDGWGTLDLPVGRLKTVVTQETARTIVSHNESPDIPFRSSINPYKGCEHGCVYCFARPSHAFLDLSPGLDFESRIFAKPNAAELLRETFRKRGYRPEVIALGANTDPYQPVERKLELTRSLLEVFVEFSHPLIIVTKSNLVLRDLDLLRSMAKHSLVSVFLSITTLDRDLARRMEPRAPTPERRLEALRGLHENGVPVGVLASPMIPAINDHELEAILDAAVAAGATTGSYLLLRLPHELKAMFDDWLREHFPDRAEKVLGRLREIGNGSLYDSSFGLRMHGQGQHAELLRRRFQIAARRLGLGMQESIHDVSHFRVPPEAGGQGRLF